MHTPLELSNQINILGEDVYIAINMYLKLHTELTKLQLIRDHYKWSKFVKWYRTEYQYKNTL